MFLFLKALVVYPCHAASPIVMLSYAQHDNRGCGGMLCYKLSTNELRWAKAVARKAT